MRLLHESSTSARDWRADHGKTLWPSRLPADNRPTSHSSFAQSSLLGVSAAYLKHLKTNHVTEGMKTYQVPHYRFRVPIRLSQTTVPRLEPLCTNQ